MNGDLSTEPQSTILIVEDEQLVVLWVESALRDVGCTVVSAADGAKALELFAQSQFAAAIIDVGLPDVGGEVVARQLRSLSPNLPIVLCTGYDATPYAAAFRADPHTRVIEKPYDEMFLIRQLKELGLELKQQSPG